MNKKNSVLVLVSAIILIASFVLNQSVSSAKSEVIKTSTSSQPAPTIVSINQKSTETQIIKATYSNGKGVWPNEFTVNAGIPVRLEVFAEIDGVGCMGSIMVPYLAQGYQYFVKGQTNVFEFTPEKAGLYEITCAMGIPHGSITVQ